MEERKNDAPKRQPKQSRAKSEPPQGWFAVFLKEWPIVKKAKWSFAVCVLIATCVAAVAVYWVVDRVYSAEIKGKDATIQTLSLRPESLPIQQQEIIDLRAQIAFLRANEWPPLSSDLIQRIARAIHGERVKSFTVYWQPGINAARFYASLQELANAEGIVVSSGGGNADLNQIVISSFTGPEGRQTAATAIVEILKEAKYPVALDLIDHSQHKPSPQDVGNIGFFMGEKSPVAAANAVRR